MSRVRGYLGLGSNLNNPYLQLQQALASLHAMPEIDLTRISPFYRSLPIGPGEQPDYCNAVVEIHTALSPLDLLEVLQAIEMAQGRDRRNVERWSPRTLDIDVLLYGDSVIDEARLTVPHPEMKNRNFVLTPLADIAAELEVPGLGLVGKLAAALGKEGLQPWDVAPA